jgi:putative FmdB family regulatory protein
MPIYEYRCQQCGQQFEKFFRSIRQVSAEVHCPACQGIEVRRLVSAAAIHSGPAGSALEAAAAQDSSSTQSPVFGRKELNEALQTKQKLREAAKDPKGFENP